MDRYSQLLLDVWREACQHIEIGELLDRVAPMLFKRLPIDAVLVRTLDLKNACVECLATSAREPALDPGRSKTECSSKELETLLEWHGHQKVVHGTSRKLQEQYPGLVPASIHGSVLVGPLHTDVEAAGALIFVMEKRHRLTAEDHSMLQVLLDPFTVAIENDRRLRELTSLRETAEAENRSLLTRLGRRDLNDTVVGAESGLRPVMERVNLVARSDVPVLVFGETGSGKEVVARAIHLGSRRADKPFLRVNCGAIPSELIDSELFGHERGSFTGALEARKGWFERADGGTLFLDECGELPLAAQVRLLRILQDGSFSRVGADKQLNVDVRIVAATNRDLQAMIKTGEFREDLWYRLAVFPIRIPPLRDRPEDIPEMATHFSLRAANRFGMPPLVPTQEDINLLVNYSWPGNVRELRAVVERAAILGDGKRLEVAKALGVVPPAVSVHLPSVTSTAPRDVPGDVRTESEFLTLDAAMALHIEAALRKTHGRIDGPYGAAELLDINPHTLRARMRKLGVNWRSFRSRPPSIRRGAG
ncbi:MAG: sigma 54-interacting transcriptional regulator [Planctomycetota bacterium]